MRAHTSTWNVALALAVGALLTFLARALIDFGFVYRELYQTTGSMGWLMLTYVIFFAGWISALLLAARGARRAMYVLLAYEAIIVVHAIGTQAVFCRFPCQTAWPLAQIVLVVNLLFGIPAVLVGLLSLSRKSPLS